MRILLLRHAETLWSRNGQHTGKTDIELTEAGTDQARSTAELFRRSLGDCDLDAVYSSPRKRALRTVELALGAYSAPIVTELLAEFDYGSYEGLTTKEIQQSSPNWNFWAGDCPGGETMEHAASRADRFIEQLRARHLHHTVCAVSHGHMIRILTARLLGLEPRLGRLFDIKPASIAELIDKDGDFAVSLWNLTT